MLRRTFFVALGLVLSAVPALAPWPAPADEGGTLRNNHCAPAAMTSYTPPSQSPTPGYAPSRPGVEVSVRAYDRYFGPATIIVPPGATVRWENHGRQTHTITSGEGLWDSGDVPPGGAYRLTFAQPGRYYYFCRHHTGERMLGTVIVQSGPRSGRGSGGYGGSRSGGY